MYSKLLARSMSCTDSMVLVSSAVSGRNGRRLRRRSSFSSSEVDGTELLPDIGYFRSPALRVLVINAFRGGRLIGPPLLAAWVSSSVSKESFPTEAPRPIAITVSKELLTETREDCLDCGPSLDMEGLRESLESVSMTRSSK